jgi:hypothetical protein
MYGISDFAFQSVGRRRPKGFLLFAQNREYRHYLGIEIIRPGTKALIRLESADCADNVY